MEFKTRLIKHKKGGAYIYIPKKILTDMALTSKTVRVKAFKGGLIVTEEKQNDSSHDRNLKKILEVKEEYEKKYPGFWVVVANEEVLAIERELKKALSIAEKKNIDVKERVIWHVGEPIYTNKIYKRRGSAVRRVFS